MAKAVTVRDKAERLAPAAESNFSDMSLIAASGVDESALNIARRHDPYSVAGGPERDRQAAQFAARLERSDDALRAGLRKASFAPSPAAKPFALGGALDASRDLDCLTTAVYYEARGEGLAGMQAVAQVVLNRVRHPAFPKTVCGVVYQGAAAKGCQFSFACDPSIGRGGETVAWRRARDVAAKALGGYVMVDVGNATHFHALRVSPGWGSNLLRVAQVGSHVFYRFGGRAGAPNAFNGAAKPSQPDDSFRPVYAGFVPTSAEGAKAAYQVLIKAIPGVGADTAQAATPAQAPVAPSAPVAQVPAAVTAAPAEAPKPAEAKPAEAPAAKPVDPKKS
jgi:spore germination cell wall hydrolase CwlJ-like protein